MTDKLALLKLLYTYCVSSRWRLANQVQQKIAMVICNEVASDKQPSASLAWVAVADVRSTAILKAIKSLINGYEGGH